MDMRMGFTTNVVMRLRIVFALIAIMVVSLSIVGLRQLANVNASIRDLTVSSVDGFVKVELTERSLKNLIVLLQQINRAATLDELAQLGGEQNETLAVLRSKISELSLFHQTGIMPGQMSQSLEQIELISILILEKNRAVLDAQIVLDAMEADLLATRDIIQGILEDEVFGIEMIMLNDTTATGTSTQTALSELAQRYSQQLLRANAVTTIALELDAVVDRVIRLRNTRDIIQIQDTEDEIRLKLRSITGLLPQIEADSTRIKLARNVVEIRDLVVGPNSVVSEIETLVKHREELDAIVSDQLIETETISLLSSRLIEDARTAIDTANAEVARNTTEMIWVLGFAVIAVLGVIALTTLIVVERQINARMSKLTHAVLALAGGAKDVDVGVHGSDELGKIALSLKVFKSNAEELLRSNKELEKFAYIAAHDLRSPLRAIQDLTTWIKEDEDNTLSDDSLEMMELLDVRVERLNNLLADLLTYSRVGSETDALAQISVANIVAELSDMLDPDKTFDIGFVGEIDTITTFATPFRHILQNLMNNSMKHHDRDTGRIRVSTALKDGRLVCHVEDDGPGIAPQYQDKIFQLFQTLRPRDEVEGSGLGLAIIQKMVENYDGHITVESNPDKRRGSIFKFDIPLGADQVQPVVLAA